MTEAYIINWNEEFLHLTIKHYQQFCDRITIYDNHSTDGSDGAARQMGCEVVKFGIKGTLSDAHYLRLKNHCWKNSRADWVIIVDADEILYHPNIKQILQDEKGTIFKTQGYQIYSDRTPENSLLEIRTGFADNNYSKAVIFDPRRIRDINYQYGAHRSSPVGVVEFCKPTLSVLHYRNIGGVERLVKRHAMYRARMSDDNKRLGLGSHYMYPDDQRIQEWKEYFSDCKELDLPGIA